jgi:hypothetical protein
VLVDLIVVGRRFQSGGGHLQQKLTAALDAAKEAVDTAYVEWAERRWPLESDYAAQVVRDALRVVGFYEQRPSELYYAVALAENARIAVAYHRSRAMGHPGGDPEVQAIVTPGHINDLKGDEMHWQIRRFIDVMNASQAGKPWPPVGATS